MTLYRRQESKQTVGGSLILSTNIPWGLLHIVPCHVPVPEHIERNMGDEVHTNGVDSHRVQLRNSGVL